MLQPYHKSRPFDYMMYWTRLEAHLLGGVTADRSKIINNMSFLMH